MAAGEPTFRDFVAARSPALLRTAFLLTGDWQRAEDLLQTALLHCFGRWDRIANHEAYVRRTLVHDPVVPADLAERVERRYRRRRTTATAAAVAAAAAGVFAVVLVPGALLHSDSRHPPTSPAAGVTSDPEAAINDARFTRTLVLDDGALRVEPAPPGRPMTSEQEAVTTFRSSGSGRVRNVLLGYGLVTVLHGKPVAPLGPAFDHRPGWVVFYDGSYLCPAPLHVIRRQIFVLADSALEAADYIERKLYSGCERPNTGPVGPYIRVADRTVSIPFREVRRTAKIVTVRYEIPACWKFAGARTFPIVQVRATRPMALVRCPLGPTFEELEVQTPPNGEPLVHGPLGPIPGLLVRIGDPGYFEYSRGHGPPR